MKSLIVAAMLASLIAMINCQTQDQTDCIVDFITNNLDITTAIARDCADIADDVRVGKLCLICFKCLIIIRVHQKSCESFAIIGDLLVFKPWNQFMMPVTLI